MPTAFCAVMLFFFCDCFFSFVFGLQVEDDPDNVIRIRTALSEASRDLILLQVLVRVCVFSSMQV